MKNRKVLLIILFMILLIVASVLYCKRYYYNNISSDIVNKRWFKYDPSTGYYEIMYFDKNLLRYTTNDVSYDNCNKYVFDKKNKIINLDCKKQFEIVSLSTNELILKTNDNKKHFFTDINNSVDYEFKNYYKKNLSEYKKELNRVKDIMKINYKSFVEILTSNEEANIYLIGENCSSIECSIVLEIMEKLLSKTNNVYYLNVNDLTDENLIYLYKLTNGTFKNNRDYYDGIYPKVLNTNKNIIVNEYDFICKGLDCNKYLDIN